MTFAALAAIAVAFGVAMLVSSVAIPVEAKITCQTRVGTYQMVNRTEINVEAKG